MTNEEKISNEQTKYAFPQMTKLGSIEISSMGMSKRELFAAMAMQGFLSSASQILGIAELSDEQAADALGRACVMAADAPLEALEK